MDLLNPVWSLKTPRCSCCSEQGALCFATCPNCNYIVLICDEVGSVYPNPKDLSQGIYGAFDDSTFLCPKCGETPLSDFRDSRSDEIQSLGFTPNDHK